MSRTLLGVSIWKLDKRVSLRVLQILTSLFLLLSIPFEGYSNGKKPISGVVVDESGEALIGVAVIESTTNATVTDYDGRFTINVLPTSTLEFSYLGYATVEIEIGTRTSVNVVLKSDTQDMEEVVVVGYATQRKESLTASVASMNSTELKKSSAPNLTNALAGRLPGLSAVQNSGTPGSDDATLYLRGAATLNDSSPLILVDGVPRDNMNVIDPNEVESISILKDASATAVFGVRGANGVILITTKRGEVGKVQLSVTADFTMQSFIANPTELNSWEYAELRNQASRNSGVAENLLTYTDYMIDMYKSGENPTFYPNTQAYDKFVRNFAPQSRVNMNISGGSDKFKYFMNAGYINQEGQFNTESESALGYDPSYKMDRYTFRANLDYEVAKGLKASMKLGSYIQNMNTPSTTSFASVDAMTSYVMMKLMGSNPTDPGPYTVAGTYSPNGDLIPAGEIIYPFGTTELPVAAILSRRGYRNTTSSNLNSSFTLDWDLGFITKGLTTKAMVSFDMKSSTSIQTSRGYDTYNAVVGAEAGSESYYTVGTANSNAELNYARAMSTNYYMNLQYSINYARSFGLHNVSGMALFQRDNWESAAQNDLPYNMLGVVGRVTYNYDDRYLAEVNIGYNGSEQFAPNNRFGFFPALSFGWLISNEDFLKNSDVINNLKLRTSYGIVGNDRIGATRFLYQDNIFLGKGHISSLGYGQSVTIGTLGNDEIQWETAAKTNIGVDLKIFNDFTFTADYFYEKRDNILITPKTVPTLMGISAGSLSKVNSGKVNNKGYEFEATYNKQINKDWNIMVRANLATNENTVIDADEVLLDDDYAHRYRTTGYSLGQQWGYIIDYSNGNGYINTLEELYNLPHYDVGTDPTLGDFVYTDLNDDGVIDEKDIAPIECTTIPGITYGFSFNVGYKGIDFSLLFQGVGKFSGYYSAFETSNKGRYLGENYHLQSWTAERYANGDAIYYPALKTSDGASHMENSFFIMDRSYLRLKNIELGYTIPAAKLRSIGVSKMRIYASGSNVFTWDNMLADFIDPEQTSQYSYPILKSFSVGANITF